MLDQVRWLGAIAEAHARRDEVATSFVFDRADRESILMLKHMRGEVVHDRETGTNGVVLGGTRRRFIEVQSSGRE